MMVMVKHMHSTFPPVFPFDWCTAWAEDRTGLYIEFELGNVTHRLRWIPPGRFMMGSPEGELERDTDETPHEVILTQGFWLGETACTQELWQAVMGDNPSHYKNLQRPVENVSWDDCQDFLNMIECLIPGLELCLPTEAQWEYACRAGTTTPFSIGTQITPDQVNYDGNHPYAGGKKGNFRKGTTKVKSLPPNPWGLYEMLGNVWEWCADWYGEYPLSQLTNPAGASEGEARVLRGGSWAGHGRECRSACRYRHRQGARHYHFGFRLSRGPFAPSREKQEEREAGPGKAERNGAGQARRKKPEV